MFILSNAYFEFIKKLRNYIFFFSESFWNLAPDCLLVLGAEFLVDWIKHAFITRFNEVSADVYKNYTVFLAYDLAQTKQKHVSFLFFVRNLDAFVDVQYLRLGFVQSCSIILFTSQRVILHYNLKQCN